MIKEDLLYIDNISECIRKINEFRLSLKEFKSNELVQDAGLAFR